MSRRKRQNRTRTRKNLFQEKLQKAQKLRELHETLRKRPKHSEAMPADDPPADGLDRSRTLRRRLLMHPEVPLALRERTALFRRLGLLIEQLAARGRTSVVKGCREPNTGWFRAPLGGSNGKQFYLWWTPAGSSPASGAGLPAGAICLRAARHHDDHAPLDAGEYADYIEIDRADRIEPDIAGSPWTAAQERFHDATEPVRVLEGSPGSGKTTALWHSVDARDDQHVAYITWSAVLAEEASAHFESFAPKGVRTSCMDFRTLLSTINGTAAPEPTPAESMLAFQRGRAATRRRKVGDWDRYPEAMYGEVRGILLGGAVSETETAQPTRIDGCLRLDSRAYAIQSMQVHAVDERNRKALETMVDALPPGTLRTAFPELAAAAEALDRLHDNPLPAALADIDRVVVDEAQDLTLTELAVITELCLRIGEDRGQRPRLLVAGDEGQTVRATAFNWGRTRALLTAELQQPATYVLETQLRCPRRIDEVCEQASRLYVGLDKETRPGGQHRSEQMTAAIQGRLIRVMVPAGEAARLLGKLSGAAGVAVITATGRIPAWVPNEWRQAVLTPEQAKGLEYQTTCLIEAGDAAWRGTDEDELAILNVLDEEARRTAIDRLRVSLSRSTETLAFLYGETDRRWAAVEHQCVPYSIDDFLEEIDTASRSTPEERALQLVDESRQLRDTNPARALTRAVQALQLLGRDGETDTTSEGTVVAEVTENALAATVHGCVNGHWNTLERATLARDTATRALEIRDRLHEAMNTDAETVGIETDLMAGVIEWKQGELTKAVMIADCLGMLCEPGERHWSSAALKPHMPDLARAIMAGSTGTMGTLYRQPVVERWLRMLGMDDEATTTARRLAGDAYDTLMRTRPRRTDEAGRIVLDAALDILATLPPDARRDRMAEEALGRPDRAAACYRAAGARDELIELARRHALWEIAAEELTGHDLEAVRWLLDFEKTMAAAPDGLAERMSEADRNRLRRSTRKLTPMEAKS